MAWPVEARNEEELEMCFEIFRFVSFLTFPLNVSVSGLQLAGNGFYFTGRGATVRCFSCNIYHSEWQTDAVLFQVGNFMHESDCALILGTDTQNVPMHRQSGHDQQVGDRNFLLSQIENESRYSDEEMAGILFAAIFFIFLFWPFKYILPPGEHKRLLLSLLPPPPRPRHHHHHHQHIFY